MRIYLIRHGQAGSRDRYDELSDLGAKQARLLGRWLADQAIPFEAVFSGGLNRQKQTAAAVAAAFRQEGVPCPNVTLDAAWSEFDLDAVYREITPLLCAESGEFQAAFEEQQRLAADPQHTVHRLWSGCDAAVFQAWVGGEYQIECESFDSFRGRILKAMGPLREFKDDATIAVFTSATPIAIWIGAALDLDLRRYMRLAGTMLNTAINILDLHGEEPRLFAYNSVPHLADRGMWTFR